MTEASLLILIAVLLPPAALEILGETVEERTINTPYGAVGPLARRVHGNGRAVWVQPYTGSSLHTDPRATILAAQELGVSQILNWDTGIAVNPLLRRGETAIVVDYVDWTRSQPVTLQTQSERRPAEQRLMTFCPLMTAALCQVLPDARPVVYLGVDGPRRETPAEARIYRQWGIDVIGQNLVPEVMLAAEAHLRYAGLVTIESYGAGIDGLTNEGQVRHGFARAIEAIPAFIARV